MLNHYSETAATAAASIIAWNGAICQECKQPYVGGHSCPGEIWYLRKRLAELEALQVRQTQGDFSRPVCPCSPARGGSGICNCIRGSRFITC